MSKKGTLYVISGPSGAGKGTVLKELFNIDSSIYYSVSATSRAPREGEINGVNYHFLSREGFEELIDSNSLLEYTSFCGNYYGTPEIIIDEKLNSGTNVILEIEIDGAAQVKKRRPDSVSVFIMPPSFEELARRLKKRNTENEADIEKRLEKARVEISMADKYNYVVINDDVHNAAVNLLDIIRNND